MGAITRAAANNITTGGVILPAAINDASVASVTGLAQVSAGDGITLISSQTASSSASLSFTTGIDSTYRTYMFKYINIHGATDNVTFQVNFRDGDSAFDATKTTTYFYAHHKEDASDPTLGYAGSHDLAQSTSYQTLQYQCGTDNDQSTCGTLFLFSPSSDTFVKHFMNTSCTYITFDYNHQSRVAGYCNTTTAIDGIDFKFSSGNIDSGTIHMYGIA